MGGSVTAHGDLEMERQCQGRDAAEVTLEGGVILFGRLQQLVRQLGAGLAELGIVGNREVGRFLRVWMVDRTGMGDGGMTAPGINMILLFDCGRWAHFADLLVADFCRLTVAVIRSNRNGGWWRARRLREVEAIGHVVRGGIALV